MSNLKFFAAQQNEQVFASASATLQLAFRTKGTPWKSIPIGRTLKIFITNASEFDNKCQFNIRSIGEEFIDLLRSVQRLDQDYDADTLIAYTYRFVSEYDISVPGRISPELNEFQQTVREHAKSFSEDAQRQIKYADERMAIAILKEVLTSDGMDGIKNVASVAESSQKTIREWKETLTKSEQLVSALQERLTEQQHGFNFVGLHDGFAKLAEQVSDELKKARSHMTIFGITLVLPSIAELSYLFLRESDGVKSAYSLGATVITSITITLLFLYFFRIALRAADSCKAQLVQLRLRMSLCAFIQSYSEYSSKIKEKNPDALSKFESLIFSGIVSNEDKLPSTFDGIEQISSLVKSIKMAKD